jgi:hypothetical protein
MTQFEVGGLFFMLWYPDQADQAKQDGLFLVPDSIVFIGKNLEPLEQDDDKGESWWFQDTESFCKIGPYPQHRDTLQEKGGRLIRLYERDLYQVVDCNGLARVLSECTTRRVRAAKPA